MIERDVELATQDGTMPVFVAHPDEGGPHPIVLVYMDALGVREELRDMTRRFASAGYYAVLANLYYRWGGPSFDGSGLADGKFDPKMMELNGALSMDMSVADAHAQLDFASRDKAAAKVGAAVGYCMGGRHAIAAGEAFGDRIKCFASIHGGRLVTDAPDSPHRRLARAKGEAYFGWAVDDPTAPAEHETIVRDVLSKRRLAHRVEVHEGALHGFAFPERYCYDKRAAETVWARLFSMFRRNLAAL